MSRDDDDFPLSRDFVREEAFKLVKIKCILRTKDPHTGDEKKKKHIYDTLKMRNWPKFKYLKKMWTPIEMGKSRVASHTRKKEEKVISWKKMTLERDMSSDTSHICCCCALP